MKNTFLITLLLATILLSACGPADSAMASAEGTAALEAVYTSAAATLAAPATHTLPPTTTNTPQATATLIPSITAAQSAALPVVVANPVSACDDSSYISDVTIPDGTVLAPGEAFTKTWSFKNTGTCAWTTSYTIIFVSGNAMSGSSTALAEAVGSGSTSNISVEMVAPTTTGTYTGYWKLQNASSASFGESVFVQIVVSDDASTITPTPTATEYTSTPTSTTVPTATTAPTNTPEPTAAPTSTPEPTAIPTETPAS